MFCKIEATKRALIGWNREIKILLSWVSDEFDGSATPRLICRSARRAVTKTSLLTQKMSAFTLAAAAPVVAPAKARVSRTAVRGKAAPVRRTVRTAAVAEAFTSANGATDTEVRIPFVRFHLRDRDRPSL